MNKTIETWISVDFWQKTIEQSIHWLLTSGPTILIILFFGFVSLKLGTVLLKKTRDYLIHKSKEESLIASFEMEKRMNTMLAIVRKILKFLIGAMISILVLKELGVDIAPMIAGAGIFGLAVSFGAQNLVKDLLTGFSMLVENQIREGDVVQINGTGGLVEKIGLRTTQLRDLSGTVHIFPNGQITTLSNMTKDWSAAVFDVGVAYKEDTDQVVAIMNAVGDQLQKDPEFHGRILAPLEIFGVDKFAASAVIIKARFKTKPIEQWNVGREYNRRLKKAFDRDGIEMPYPHVSIYAGERTKPFPTRIDEKIQNDESSYAHPIRKPPTVNS